ncbi:hypothetical protein EHM69_12750 [candidate division KSB1 bacterium]|nr:MAG: hypothetical protein EHM69_12750 [candidate division KSB1 bacterium]
MYKRLFITLLAFCTVILPACAADESQGFQYFTPTVYDETAELLVSGKRRTYFVLQEGQQIEIKLKGPSRLKIMSRVVLSGASDSTQYTYLALRKGSRKTLSFSHQTYYSDKVAFAGAVEGTLSVSRTKIVDIPRGDHTYKLYLPKDSKRKVLFRFALETNAFTNGTPVVAMTPAEFTTPVDLVSGEEITTYYRIGTGHNVTLNLIGPATLKVLARIEYDQKMSGLQKWKVQVQEDGRVKSTYSLSTRKSDITNYREISSLVASRAEIFYVEIPAGEHRYIFLMPDNHRTTLLRFLLPASQLERD